MEDQPNYPFWFCMMIAGAKTEADLAKLEADPNYALAILEEPRLQEFLEEKRASFPNDFIKALREVALTMKMSGMIKP